MTRFLLGVGAASLALVAGSGFALARFLRRPIL